MVADPVGPSADHRPATVAFAVFLALGRLGGVCLATYLPVSRPGE